MGCEDSAERPRSIEAVVHAGGAATPYVRAGEGEVVVLLRAVPCAVIAGSPFFLRMAARRRVIGVTAPPGADVRWLRDLIEGLGLDRPELMGERRLARLLLEFAEAHPERASWVTLLDEEAEAA